MNRFDLGPGSLPDLGHEKPQVQSFSPLTEALLWKFQRQKKVV